MAYSFTTALTSTTVLSSVFNTNEQAQDILIQNQGANPVYFAIRSATATTTNTLLDAGKSIYFPNRGVDKISFISTTGGSVVNIEAF